MKRFSPQVIVFLKDAITGGPGIAENQSPWPYRAGWQLVNFFNECGYGLSLGQSSRVPWTETQLETINNTEGIEGITKIICRLIDPRDWLGKQELLQRLVKELNQLLFYDGYEIIYDQSSRMYILHELGKTYPIVQEVLKKEFLDIQAVSKDFERALASINTDPADSITSSCSFVESVCKAILDRAREEYPKEQTIPSLTKAVCKKLSLFPENVDDENMKRLLGSLGSISYSIGTLRNRYGDAHGRTVDPSIINPLHAKLAVGAASTLALFLIEVSEALGIFIDDEEEATEGTPTIEDIEDIPL